MNILSRVCAEFRDRKGNVIHRIGRNDLLVYHEAPDAIQEDILFKMLVADGSIELPPEGKKEKRKLEDDPMKGIDPSGKKEKVETETKHVKAETKPAGKAAETEKK